MKVQLGDKCKIPLTKQGDSHIVSAAVRNAKEAGQDYLFYNGKNEEGHYLLDEDFNPNWLNGDFFYFDEIELYDDFILPEKWVIKITNENRQIIKNYFNTDNIGYSFGYYYPYNVEQTKMAFSSKPDDCTEITFEQFEKYILNKQEKTNNMNKKIIGYKLVKKEFGLAANAILELKNISYDAEWKDNLTNEYDIQKLRNAGVLDLWFEPVYEDEKIMIDKYEVKIINSEFGGIKSTKIDGNEFTKLFWEAAKLVSTHNKAKIMVGCSKQFDVSLETINKILNKLNNNK